VQDAGVELGPARQLDQDLARALLAERELLVDAFES
jgi:hypothetical protein